MPPLLQAAVQAGIISQEDAERVARGLDPDYARLWTEQVLEQSFGKALSAQQRRLLELLRASDYTPTEAQIAAFWERENELLWNDVQPDILDAIAERATIGAVAAGFDTWDFVNQSVIDWAEDYYINADLELPGSIPQLNLTARTRFQTAFVRWQRGELDELVERGLPDLIEAITPVFGPERAERIAVTETTRIFTEAQRFVEESNPDTLYLRMLTAADEKVCPICGPLHGAVRKKADKFYEHPQLGKVQGPPFHVRCRCGETPETALTVKVPLGPEDQFKFEAVKNGR